MSEQERWPRWSDCNGFIRRWPETGPVSCCLPSGTFLDHDDQFDGLTGEERWQKNSVAIRCACTEAHAREVLAARGQKVPDEWETPDPGPLPGPWQEHRLPDGRTLKWTGEFREPSGTEAFTTGPDWLASLGCRNFGEPAYILRPTGDPKPAPDADGWCYGVCDESGQVLRWRDPKSSDHQFIYRNHDTWRTWPRMDEAKTCMRGVDGYRTCTRAEAEHVHGKPLPMDEPEAANECGNRTGCSEPVGYSCRECGAILTPQPGYSRLRCHPPNLRCKHYGRWWNGTESAGWVQPGPLPGPWQDTHEWTGRLGVPSGTEPYEEDGKAVQNGAYTRNQPAHILRPKGESRGSLQPGPWQETHDWTGEVRRARLGEHYANSSGEVLVWREGFSTQASYHILRPKAEPQPELSQAGPAYEGGPDEWPKYVVHQKGYFGPDDARYYGRWESPEKVTVVSENGREEESNWASEIEGRLSSRLWRLVSREEAERFGRKEREPVQACPPYEGGPNGAAFTKPQNRKETAMNTPTTRRSLPVRAALWTLRRIGECLWPPHRPIIIGMGALAASHPLVLAMTEQWWAPPLAGAANTYQSVAGAVAPVGTFLGDHWQALAGVAASGLCMWIGKRMGRKA